MAVEECARLERNICKRSVQVIRERRKRFLIFTGELQRLHEQLIDFIGSQIDLIGDAEGIKTSELKLLGIRSHDGDRVDTDRMIIAGLKIFFRILIHLDIRGFVLKNLSQEDSRCRFNNNKEVDGIGKERFAELASVSEQSMVIDLCDTVASEYLCYLSDVVVLKVFTLIKRFKCHILSPSLLVRFRTNLSLYCTARLKTKIVLCIKKIKKRRIKKHLPDKADALFFPVRCRIKKLH